MSAYDLDLHAWAQEQAAALRRRSANEIDWENVAEEIESLGKQQVAELRSRLEVLILHLLKWAYQSERVGNSWLYSVLEQRRKIVEHVAENPSLKPIREDVFHKAYQDARYAAGREMVRDPRTLPEEAPFTLEQVMQDGWMPAPVSSEESPG